MSKSDCKEVIIDFVDVSITSSDVLLFSKLNRILVGGGTLGLLEGTTVPLHCKKLLSVSQPTCKITISCFSAPNGALSQGLGHVSHG